ncbi:dihydrofolate reductase [Frigoribacterium sp. UYMn621]
MGRFVYWMNVSLDLRIEQVPGDDGAGEWLRIGEELHREFNARARELAVMVQGRVIFETMEEYWPRARTDDTLPDFLREYGEIWTDAAKVLVSRTRRHADFNTRVIGGDHAIEQLAVLRAETEGAIGVGAPLSPHNYCGRGFWTSCCSSLIPRSSASAGPCSTTTTVRSSSICSSSARSNRG